MNKTKKLILILSSILFLSTPALADDIKLRWTPPAPGEEALQLTNYLICRGQAADPAQQTTCVTVTYSTPMTETYREYTLTGVENIRWYLHARAQNASGISEPSSVVMSDPTVPPIPIPDPPGGLEQIERIISRYEKKILKDARFGLAHLDALEDLKKTLKGK